ncbi:pentatricopeptide repeat (PPR) superfamily protein [Actinidia rufa]|uniref:Pentatricopeptide repeat (PPR) superfamily protein n=1 Tax=Actinidia rufa TaxID=165716 RepID=A0A7J0ES97_9ERIC|nr:pentatricopeptide repeat (PPR) superfamily protein [Actinidia rufa]
MKWLPTSQRELLCTLLQPVTVTVHPPLLLPYAPIFQLLTGQNKPHTSVNLGRQVHAHMLLRGLNPNASIAAKMVAMYASSGDLRSSVLIFDRIDYPSSLLYNSMIRAYTVHGYFEKAIETYSKMQLIGLWGDHFTYPFVLKSCAELLVIEFGRSVHGQSLRGGLDFDLYVGTSLIDMYVKCGVLRDARMVFDELPMRDVSAWNALIAGYMKDGMIHIAEELFGKMSKRNIVSWTAMISGYTQNGLGERAMCLFDDMLKEGSDIKPNWVTVMSVLPACAHSAALEQGRRIHKFACDVGLDAHPSVQTAVVAMASTTVGLLYSDSPELGRDVDDTSYQLCFRGMIGSATYSLTQQAACSGTC